MWILARYSLGLHPYVSLNLVAKYWLVEKPQSIATSVIDRFSPGGDCSMIFFALLRRASSISSWAWNLPEACSNM